MMSILEMAYQRMFRAIVLGGGALGGGAVLGVICDACGSGETALPSCYPSGSFSSYCGIVNVTTDCGVSFSCDDGGAGNVTTCTFPAPARDCTFTVTLADGTQTTLPVTVSASGIPDCSNAGVYGVALPLECRRDAGGDAGVVDARSDASDATNDGSLDGPVE